jgi:HSP20 family protein
MATQSENVPARRALFPDLESPLGGIRDMRWPFALDTFRPLFERETPAVDMFERDGKVVVKAEMPGIKREDMEVNISEGQITISGERRHDEETRQEEYYRSERTYGRMYRALALPKGCDARGAVANVKDGVLEVVIPKHTEAAAKKIEVKSA